MTGEEQDVSRISTQMKVTEDDSNPDASFNIQPTSLQIGTIEEAQPSFASSLATAAKSSIKRVVQGTYATLEFATRSREHAALTAAIVLFHASAAAATCLCSCIPDRNHQSCVYLGPVAFNNTCTQKCRSPLNMKSLCIEM